MIKRICLICIIVLTLITINQVLFADDQNSCTVSCPDVNLNSPFAFTSKAFGCVKNVLDVMFLEDCAQYNILKTLKDNLKTAVLAALLLYVVLLGMEVATSGTLPSKKYFFTAILKFGFVLYFTIGDGLNDIVYKGGMATMTSLSSFLMQASTGTLCQYPLSDYAGYEYLAMWDTIDCRIAQYFMIKTASSTTNPASVLPFGIFQTIIPLIFALEIMLAIFLIFFAVFIFSIALSILHFFILAMIGLGLMTYFGVIFVPMILFSYTTRFFHNWWRASVSFALQPVVITIFIAFPFLLLDNIMYEDCKFTQSGTGWEISSASDTCKGSLGYQMSAAFTSDFLTSIPTTFFDVMVVNLSSTSATNMLTALLKVLFFCYLFLMLAEKGGEIASKLTSGPRIGGYAIGVAKTFKKFTEKITKKPEKAPK